MENISNNIGEYIINKLDEQNNNEPEVTTNNNKSNNNFIKSNKIIKKDNITKIKVNNKNSKISYNSDNTDNSDNNNNTDNSDNNNNTDNSDNNNNSDNSDNTDNSDNDNKPVDDENKFGIIPIMIELCKEFKFPNIKYDKKKYSNLKNPSIDEKIKYFKKHLLDCEKCNITNNNNKELANYIITAKISFQEHLKVSCDLEEGIEKYQNALKYDSYGYDLDINNMKVNYINDNENIYNNCLLIYVTLQSKE